MTTANATPSTLAKPPRLLSVDLVRGLTIAFMIMVNNNGSDRLAYRWMNHSPWNGFTPTDLVFPTFLFIMGVSLVLSDNGRRARALPGATAVPHILRRTVLLFFFGLVVNGFPFFHLGTLRIYGVLQRIAVCYLVASLLLLATRRVWVWVGASAALLLGYWWLMRFVPVPGHGIPGVDIPLLDPDLNPVAWLDRHLLPGRLYEGTRDPEGLLSDFPAFVSAFLGVLAGFWITRNDLPHSRRALGLGLAAVVLLGVAVAWNPSFPINKKLWTSTFVLFAGGWSLLATAIVYFLVEVKRFRGKYWEPVMVLGTNAITAYVLSELLSSAIQNIHVAPQLTLQRSIYNHVFQPIVNPAFGSFVYSFAFLAVCWLPISLLYRRKIFLKL